MPRGLRRRSAVARLLRSWVRIPLLAWIFVCCERCVLSGRGLCDEPITRPEKSYRLWCVVVCGQDSRWVAEPRKERKSEERGGERIYNTGSVDGIEYPTIQKYPVLHACANFNKIKAPDSNCFSLILTLILLIWRIR
jgi:hypothetical protein